MSDLKDRLELAALQGALQEPRSDALRDVVETHPLKSPHGVMIVYGDRSHRVLRAEMEHVGGRVNMHKNVGQATGLFANTPRWNELTVTPRESSARARLTIRIMPDTSPHNPVYQFWQGQEEIGRGSGERMDIGLARQLFGMSIGYADDGMVSPDIIAWINGHLR